MATTGIRLYLAGSPTTIYTNNSDILITSLGTDHEQSPSEALVCNTDYRPCCRHFPVVDGVRLPSITQGEWHYPNATRLPFLSENRAFYRTSGENDGTKNLFRRDTDVASPIGSFCCEIPVANDTNQILCANIGETYCVVKCKK